MFKFIKRIMGLSGEYRKKLNRAYVLSFFESLASNVPICILLYVLMTIINGSLVKIRLSLLLPVSLPVLFSE